MRDGNKVYCQLHEPTVLADVMDTSDESNKIQPKRKRGPLRIYFSFTFSLTKHIILLVKKL